jgi:hypothetical protein
MLWSFGELFGARFAVWGEPKAKSQEPKAHYLRNSHIAQPATNTPPKNIAKQYSP